MSQLTNSVNLSLRLAELFVESCKAKARGNEIDINMSVFEELFRSELTEVLPAGLVEPAMDKIRNQLAGYVTSVAFVASMAIIQHIPTTAGLILFQVCSQIYIGLYTAGVNDDAISRVNPVTEPWTPRR